MTTSRIIVVLGFVAGFLAGRSLLSLDVVRVLLVGLGFVAASVLPTITLLVNGMTSTGRSVKAVNDLHMELRETVGRLFRVLMLAVVSVVLLLPVPVHEAVPFLTIGGLTVLDPVGRLLSGLSLSMLIALTVALNAIPAAIYRSLELRKTIAIDEARQRNADRISQVDAAAVFSTKEGFGEKVPYRVDA